MASEQPHNSAACQWDPSEYISGTF